VLSNLTLNLGLRYENHTPWVEVQNRQVNFAPISGQIQFAGRPCIYADRRALYNSHNTGLDFQPRIGFAWTPSFLNGKTVVRGAYTISSYLEGTGINLRLPMNPPFTRPEFETDYHDSNLPATKIEQGILPPTDPFQNAVLRLWDPNTQPAISQQWNLSLQHQLSNTTTLQIGYVGQHGTHLMVPMPYLQKQLHADERGRQHYPQPISVRQPRAPIENIANQWDGCGWQHAVRCIASSPRATPEQRFDGTGRLHIFEVSDRF
jgi:hypothetical protein